jgi:hypothetical protein
MADGRPALPALRPPRGSQTDEVKTEQWAAFGEQQHDSFPECNSTFPDPNHTPRSWKYSSRYADMGGLSGPASSPCATVHARHPAHVPLQPGVSSGSVVHAPDARTARQYALRPGAPRSCFWIPRSAESRRRYALPSSTQRGRSTAPIRTHAYGLFPDAASSRFHRWWQPSSRHASGGDGPPEPGRPLDAVGQHSPKRGSFPGTTNPSPISFPTAKPRAAAAKSRAVTLRSRTTIRLFLFLFRL